MTTTTKKLSEAQFKALVLIAEAGPNAYFYAPYRQQRSRLYRKTSGDSEHLSSAAGASVKVLREMGLIDTRVGEATSRLYLTDEGMRQYLTLKTTPRFEKLTAEKEQSARRAKIAEQAHKAWNEVVRLDRERSTVERAIISQLHGNGFNPAEQAIRDLAEQLKALTDERDAAKGHYDEIRKQATYPA